MIPENAAAPCRRGAATICPTTAIASSGGPRISQPAAADPRAVTDRDHSERGPDGKAIVHESVTARCVRVVGEQQDRADQRAAGEHAVLERAEPEHPHPRLRGGTPKAPSASTSTATRRVG